MVNIFYRFHQADAPRFIADNAWSFQWGFTFSKDGSRAQCLFCDGTGHDATACPTCDGTGDAPPTPCPACDGDGVTNGDLCPTCDGQGERESLCDICEGDGTTEECDTCDGEGWVDCDRGYSCTWTAEDLLDYFGQRHISLSYDDGVVYVFEGEYEGDGGDGEPLAVPTRVVEQMTWPAFVEKYGGQ